MLHALADLYFELTEVEAKFKIHNNNGNQCLLLNKSLVGASWHFLLDLKICIT